jgi:ribokinase
MKSAAAGDILLLQNETNAAAEAIELGFRAGMRVCLNPAPFDENIKKLPLEKLSFLILNETEAEGLAGTSGDPAYLTGLIASRHPKTAVVMTLGSKGVIMMSGGKTLSHPGYKVKAVDTTAAGDTFIGFFLAVKLRGGDDGEALATACRAASICVTRRGAAGSIPSMAELSAAQT